MNPQNRDTVEPPRRLRAFVLILVLLAPLTVGACSHAAAPRPTKASLANCSRLDGRDHGRARSTVVDDDSAGRRDWDAAWSTRPTYTKTSARTERLTSTPSIIPRSCSGCRATAAAARWAMAATSTATSSRALTARSAFEEHASYCGICVDITLRAKQLVASGASLSVGARRDRRRVRRHRTRHGHHEAHVVSRATIECEMLSRLGLPQQAGPGGGRGRLLRPRRVPRERPARAARLVPRPASRPPTRRTRSCPIRAQAACAPTVQPRSRQADQASSQALRAPSAATVVAAAPPPSRRRRLGPLARVAIGSLALVGVAGGRLRRVRIGQAVRARSELVRRHPKSSGAALDTARIATLMETIQADPNDTRSAPGARRHLFHRRRLRELRGTSRTRSWRSSPTT